MDGFGFGMWLVAIGGVGLIITIALALLEWHDRQQESERLPASYLSTYEYKPRRRT